MIEEGMMKTKAVFSEDKTHRYILDKQWNETLPKMAVIMLQSGKSDALIQDVTTCNIINCVIELEGGYGGVSIVNLFSRLDLELEADSDIDDFTDEENDRQIEEVAKEAEVIVLAYGKAQETSLCVKQRVNEVLGRLELYKDKMYLIGDGKGRKGFSAMYPKVRNKWILYKAFEEELKSNQQENTQAEKVAEHVEELQESKREKKGSTSTNNKESTTTRTKKNQKKSS